MACLAYKNSKVSYKDKPYSRTELFEIRSNLMTKIMNGFYKGSVDKEKLLGKRSDSESSQDKRL
jgi:hypothetical protein